MSEHDEQRLKEIDDELEKIQELFKEYRSWYDPKTQKIWFPPGRYFNYDDMVDREQELLKERKALKEGKSQTKEFFVPHETTPEDSERKYQEIKSRVSKSFPGPFSERRIFRIKIKERNTIYEFEVGGKAGFHEVVDEVFSIFEAPSTNTAYLICTPSRGVNPRTPMPVIVGLHDVIEIEDFED